MMSAFKTLSITVLLISVLIGMLGTRKGSEYAVLKPVADAARALGYPQLTGITPLYGGRTGFSLEDLPKDSLKNKTAIVTGGHEGANWWVAYHLASRGCKVILACTEYKRCYEAAMDINRKLRTITRGISRVVHVSNLATITNFARDFRKQFGSLDIMVFDPEHPYTHFNNVTDWGMEAMYQRNFFGHYYLYRELQPLFEESVKRNGWGAIVNIVKPAHFTAPEVGAFATMEEMISRENFRKYSPSQYFALAQMANILFTEELARRYANDPIYVNAAFHGAVQPRWWDAALADLHEILLKIEEWAHEEVSEGLLTGYGKEIVEFLRNAKDEVLWSEEEASLTATYLAASPEVREKDIRGRYFHPLVHELARNPAFDTGLGKTLLDNADKYIEENDLLNGGAFTMLGTSAEEPEEEYDEDEDD